MIGKIRAITASAGAGKTTRIVRDIADEVARRAPESFLVTTFTVKAADEVLERARAELFRRGDHASAARLLGARFGTVNAICGQLVKEFALDLGRSPAAVVIGEAGGALSFSVAADAAIGAHAPTLNRLARAFGYDDPRPAGIEAPDWRRTVHVILSMAQANGLAAGDLHRSAERSVDTFSALLPPSTASARELDRRLAAALAAAMSARPSAPSATAARDLPILGSAHLRASRGEALTWSQWARLTRVGCAPTKDGRVYQAALGEVMAAAGLHAAHPRLGADAAAFVGGVFACAADAMDAYRDWKSERGLMDFTDQEALALDVLSDPALRTRLRERVGRVFVDEFQDSSPLQVAIFMALAEVAEESTWVGDPKQAIYGFRGADTELTRSAFAGAGALGATAAEVLSTSWRSRPGIVAFSNAMFGDAFEVMGLPAARHAFSRAARSDAGFARPPLAWWPLAGRAAEQADALAGGVRAALEAPGDWLVEGTAGERRPLAAGDVAILCRSRADVARFAAALARAGLPVAVERSGLVRTPHVELVLAACRWIVDDGDRLALAEMARFSEVDPLSDAWLEAAAADRPDEALRSLVPAADALDAIRGQLANLTPAEVIDAVIAVPAVMGLIEGWGDHAVRLDDLEALRGSAAAYEVGSCASGGPATLRGLLLELDASDPKRPPSAAADAVQVMTFHGAKGLEWPMAILTGLGWESRARLYEPVAEADGPLDWRKPLDGRWIRLWPWPFGASGSGGPLDVAARGSPIGRSALRRAWEEDARLLYVGVTRARDYLVFAPPAAASLNWFSVLDAPASGPHVHPPAHAGEPVVVGDVTFPIGFQSLAADGSIHGLRLEPTFVAPRPGAVSVPSPPLLLRPSLAAGEGWAVAERILLGDRLPMKGVDDVAALGEALHAVLAYDDPCRADGTRMADAQAILSRWGASGFGARNALVASDRLHAVLDRRWPGASIRREVPVVARRGSRLVRGRIDLLVEFEGAACIIDHKSFPGGLGEGEVRALRHAPQLGLYAEALEAVSGRGCGDVFVHLPVVGTLLRMSSTPLR